MPKASKHKMDFTVVVPTYNSSSNLQILLESLAKQSDKDFSVIVVDDPLSKDDVERVVTSYTHRLNIKYVRAEQSGLSAARNKGILLTDADVCCFIDSDCIADVDWIKRTRECWQSLDDNVAGLRGKVLPMTQGFMAELLCNGVYISEIQRGGGDNISYRRQILIDVGLFDPTLRLNEDGDLERRVLKKKYRIEYDDGIVVYHNYGFTVERFFKREIKFGRGFYMLWVKTRDLSTIVPILFTSTAFLFISTTIGCGLSYILPLLTVLSILAVTYYRRYIEHFLRRESVVYLSILLAIYVLKNICNALGFFMQMANHVTVLTRKHL
ncbi:MAG: glycosyltransferase [Candidatus Bathyarchaeia archaeon]